MKTCTFDSFNVLFYCDFRCKEIKELKNFKLVNFGNLLFKLRREFTSQWFWIKRLAHNNVSLFFLN